MWVIRKGALYKWDRCEKCDKVHSINGKDVSKLKRYTLKMGQMSENQKGVQYSINGKDVSNPKRYNI